MVNPQPVIAAKCVMCGVEILPNVSAQADSGGIKPKLHGEIRCARAVGPSQRRLQLARKGE
ncbi:protein of unknown function [Bradyrhizobium vignae]|uniref:Uncharacterized protein n=1 Tax=Bradyrhizobium vignae TaxID=1549949 RepID=A0A2U3Q7N4_9BRAD|nr:protein of unknown function [Bradyrhizobium vignae]